MENKVLVHTDFILPAEYYLFAYTPSLNSVDFGTIPND